MLYQWYPENGLKIKVEMKKLMKFMNYLLESKQLFYKIRDRKVGLPEIKNVFA